MNEKEMEARVAELEEVVADLRHKANRDVVRETLRKVRGETGAVAADTVFSWVDATLKGRA